MGAQSYPTLTAQEVPDLTRLAVTPNMDGKVDEGEWEPFDKAGLTFFQWEPDVAYWAAKLKAGQDAVLSYDANGDGWLVGDDNLEVRATVKDANVALAVRRLDATDPNGPKWVDSGIPAAAIGVSARMTEGQWELEGSLIPGQPLPRAGSRAGLRIDLFPAGNDLGPAYVPRAMNFVRFSFDSSRGLFPGFSWKPNLPERIFSRDDEVALRYDFKVERECPLLRGLNVQGEGRANEALARLDGAFPPLNRDRTASLTYRTRLAEARSLGYRVIRATVTAFDGSPCVLRTSLKVADQVDMGTDIPSSVNASGDAQIVKAGVNIWSVTRNRVEGRFSYKLPSEWTATRGMSQGFTIARPRGRAKVPIEFIVPKGTKGSFVVELVAVVGDKTIRKQVSLKAL